VESEGDMEWVAGLYPVPGGYSAGLYVDGDVCGWLVTALCRVAVGNAGHDALRSETACPLGPVSGTLSDSDRGCDGLRPRSWVIADGSPEIRLSDSIGSAESSSSSSSSSCWRYGCKAAGVWMI
jgi:hypothetical protein